jgi:6-pyruvoyltetrahydropterin/6-carboxytetrahydropterin synthase
MLEALRIRTDGRRGPTTMIPARRTATLKRRFTFDAAHTLPFHPGKCKHLHGHTYRLEVAIRGPLDGNGMIVDFAEVKSIVRERILDRCDHRFLDEVFPFPTTAENLARHFFETLRPHLPGLRSIELWETPDCSVVVTEEDFEEGT